MIKPDMIPDEVCLGLLHALLANPQPTPQSVRAAIAAALNAWPGASYVPGLEQWGKTHGAHIHLPLPQEPQ
jgi:hypothetical protein